VRLGAGTPSVGFYSTHSFVALQTCGLPIRATKPSPTAGTLYEIVPKLVGKYRNK